MNEPAVPIDPAPSALATSRFTSGEAIGTTFRVYFRRGFLSFAAVALIFLAPAILLDTATAASEAASALSNLLWSVTGSFVLAGITRGCLDALEGKPPRVGNMLATAVGRGFRVLGAGIVAGIVRLLALAALVVPGLIAIAGLFVAETAAAAEPETGPRACLGRSWSLTQGRRWSVLGVFLLFQLFPLGLVLATGVAVEAFSGEPLARVAALVGFTLTALALGLQAAAGAVTYHRLRAEKEGAAPEALARVFE